VPDPFAVDEGKALDALTSAWGDQYDEIWVTDEAWYAHHRDAGKDEFLSGTTPDELNRAIRADFARRSSPPPPGRVEGTRSLLSPDAGDRVSQEGPGDERP
jgi:hypothetical protein